MDALTDLLQTETTLWAAGVIGIVIGLLVGALLGIALGRARRTSRSDGDDELSPRTSGAPRGRAAGRRGTDEDRAALTGLAVHFVDAADTAHNTLLAVDRKELADTELEDALHSENPGLRRLAEAIMTLAGIHNELRVRAPRKALDSAESLFTHLTYTAMDGVADEDAFSTTYQGRKTAFIDAVRAESGV